MRKDNTIITTARGSYATMRACTHRPILLSAAQCTRTLCETHTA